jgi:hypothetical protein
MHIEIKRVVAERILRVSPCPVLTVRHSRHEFLVDD